MAAALFYNKSHLKKVIVVCIQSPLTKSLLQKSKNAALSLSFFESDLKKNPSYLIGTKQILIINFTWLGCLFLLERWKYLNFQRGAWQCEQQ